MIFILTKFSPVIILNFHLFSKWFLPLATVKPRQFRVNNTVVDNNMKEENIVARTHRTHEK